MSKYGKPFSKKIHKTLSESHLQKLKDYQKAIYHNANAKWAIDFSVLGKNPSDNDKYDIDFSEIKDTLIEDFANYLPLEDHDGKLYENSDYYATVQWYPSDTKNLFEENISDPTMKSLMHKIGWCDEQGNHTKIIYNLNKNGHRCKNLDGDIGKGILFLGCSHTFGVGLNEKDTFAYKVADHFGRECFNYGLPGKGLDTAALYTSLFLQDDVDLNLIDAVVVFTPPPGRIAFFHYETNWKLGRGYNTLRYNQLQNDPLIPLNYYNGYLKDIPIDELHDTEEIFNLKQSDSASEVQKKLDKGLQSHIDNYRSSKWEHYLFTKENNFYRDLLAIDSIKCFCLENNIPLIVTEGTPTIASKDDWARDMCHFGKRTHDNIFKDIVSKLKIFLDK